MLTKKDHPHHLGHRSRLKERLRKDPRALADYEVLELLLGYAQPRKDTKPLAKILMDKFGGLRGVYEAKGTDLELVEGFGPGLSSFWDLWREFLSRLAEQAVSSRAKVEDPQIVADIARERLGGLETEEFWVLLLDAANRIMFWERLSRGTVDQVPVYPREVLALALERKAAGLILVHNHPGGDPRPSDKDREITRQVSMAAHPLGVKVLDHVVIGGGDYFSFRKSRLL